MSMYNSEFCVAPCDGLNHWVGTVAVSLGGDRDYDDQADALN